MKINQLDLFSGIGGFHLGFTNAGYEVNSYFSEIDAHAIAIYKHQFKNSTYVGSVRDVRGADLPRIDLITFGSPCQDFSQAGNRRGLTGDRSVLISEAIRLIGECRPRVFIWENVKGTFSSNDGADFAAILKSFVDIGGYRFEWQLCNTTQFLPQNRERVYLVGHLAESSGDFRGVFPIGVSGKESHKRSSKVASTLQSPGNACGNYKGMNMIKVKSATKYGYDLAEEGDSINLQNINSTTRRGRVGKQQAQTLDTLCEQAVVTPKIIGYTRDRETGEVTNRSLKDVANTLHQATGGGGNTDQYVQPVQIGQGKKTFAVQGGTTIGKAGQDAFTIRRSESNGVRDESYRIRRLTPIECERLQGFPDDHTKYGIYDGLTKEVSKTHRYKTLGNAVTTNVVSAIAERLKPLYL